MKRAILVLAAALGLCVGAGCAGMFGTRNATRVYMTLEDQNQAYLFYDRLRPDITYSLRFKKFDGDTEYDLNGTVTLYASDGKILYKEHIEKISAVPEIATFRINNTESYKTAKGKNLLCVEGDLATYVVKERMWQFVPGSE